jgi:hypothetical protein
MSIDMVRDPNISASAMLAFISALLILLIGMLGDAMAARLGRLNQNTVASIQTRQLLADRSASATVSEIAGSQKAPPEKQ